jgi:predicted Na+-dependent transporter
LPSGAKSEVFTEVQHSRGSVTANLLSFIAIPAWVNLTLGLFMSQTNPISGPLAYTARRVALLTVVPVGLGLIVSHKWVGFAHRAQPAVKAGSAIFLARGNAPRQGQISLRLMSEAGDKFTVLLTITFV